jgi:hypothetical protein
MPAPQIDAEVSAFRESTFEIDPEGFSGAAGCSVTGRKEAASKREFSTGCQLLDGYFDAGFVLSEAGDFVAEKEFRGSGLAQAPAHHFLKQEFRTPDRPFRTDRSADALLFTI